MKKLALVACALFFCSCVQDEKENFVSVSPGKYTSILSCTIDGAAVQIKNELSLNAEYYTFTMTINNYTAGTETGNWSQDVQSLCLESECRTIRNVAVNMFEASIDDPEVAGWCNTTWETYIKE